jgi:hypothetical protein
VLGVTSPISGGEERSIPPLAAQVRIPVPSVVNCCPLEPAPFGKVRVVSADKAAGAWIVRSLPEVEATLINPLSDATGPEKVVRAI